MLIRRSAAGRGSPPEAQAGTGAAAREGNTTMKLCNYIQAQLLEHQYGLVDDGPRRDLEEHLTECADCRRALDRARQEQALLAAAARKEFPEVQFAPPAVVEMNAQEVER